MIAGKKKCHLSKEKPKKKEPVINPFLGEIIDIFLTSNGVEIFETESGPFPVNSPLRVTGYLLDIDDLNYYLGHTPDSVSIKIPIQHELFMQIAQETNELANVLKMMPDPTNTDLN